VVVPGHLNFLPKGEKSERVYPKGFRFSAKHDVFSILREEKTTRKDFKRRGGENILKSFGVSFSPQTPLSKTF